jgi:Ca-activated chloride channel family protein
MSFLWPDMLFLLLLVPVGIFLYVRQQRRRARLATSFGQLGFAQGAAGRRWEARRHIPPAFFLAGLAVLTVGLARPQTTLSLPREEGTVILDFDVSGSMAATDVSPTRLQAAKATAREFVQRQPPTVQIGVVAFSDGAFSTQAPTDDASAILAAINRLAPQRGTSVAQGILSSLNLIAVANGEIAPPSELYSPLLQTPTPTPTPVPQGTYTSALIVLLSDGENNENPDPMAAAQRAADRGVRIYTVGIGSPEGTTLHVNGFTVFTQLDEAALRQIAQTTGGTYYNAQSMQDLRTIYADLDRRLITRPEKTEVTSLFAGVSILLLLIGGAISLVWFGRVP